MGEEIRPESFKKYKILPFGAIIGDVGVHSCKIWIKVPYPGHWTIAISSEPFHGDLDDFGGSSVENWLEQQGYSFRHKKEKIGDCLCMTYEFNDKTFFKPGGKYYYIVSSDLSQNEGLPDSSLYGRTIIGDMEAVYFHLPAARPNSISFAAFSCHDPFSWKFPNEGAWPVLERIIERQGLDFSVAGGDQVYVDTNKAKRMQDLWEWLGDNKNQVFAKYKNGENFDEEGIKQYLIRLIRQYYRIYWNVESMGRVLSKTPTYMIWDDHEIMDGWGSRTKSERQKLLRRTFQKDDDELNNRIVDLTWKAAAQAYYEHQHSHNPTTTGLQDDLTKMEWDYPFSRGDFRFYVLDMRGHHDCERESYRLLGENQFKRLTQWLKDWLAGARSAFIVSPVPVVHWNEELVNTLDIGSVKDDFMDEWGHKTNHKERNKLLTAVFRASKKHKVPITFISGDVHCASIYEISKPEVYPESEVYQVTTSPISRKPASKLSTIGYQKSGPLPGMDGVFCEQLYSQSGVNNFAVFRVGDDLSGSKLAVDYYWPGDEDGEVYSATIDLSGADR